VRGESVGAAKVDLNGHEAGNGGYSQGTPKARRAFLYSEIAHHRILAPKTGAFWSFKGGREAVLTRVRRVL
jgi:hypothetical protein